MDPRPAATVVVARRAEPGVETLVLRRSEQSRFAPGFVVFPGGVIEPEDGARAERLFGDPAEVARSCVLRELYEEAGILLTSRGLESRPGSQPFDDLTFAPPPAGDLPEMARWVAPEFLEVRFDARFFAIAAPMDLEPHPDGIEIERAWWARPEALLRENERGEAPLLWPTMVTLWRLAECETVEDVLALRVEQIPRGTPP